MTQAERQAAEERRLQEEAAAKDAEQAAAAASGDAQQAADPTDPAGDGTVPQVRMQDKCTTNSICKTESGHVAKNHFLGQKVGKSGNVIRTLQHRVGRRKVCWAICSSFALCH